jgi:hypothetical protein
VSLKQRQIFQSLPIFRLLSIACFFVLIFAGSLLVLSPSVEVAELKKVILPGIGASLVAAGIVGVVTHIVIEPATARRLEMLIKSIVGAPARLLDERHMEATIFLELTESGERIDIMSLTLDAFVQSHNRRQVLNWVVSGKHFRLLVLEEQGCAAMIRGMEEDDENLPQKIGRTLKILRARCRDSRRDIAGSQCKGSFEIRTHDGLPYFAYFRSDDEAVLGFYFRHLQGSQSEVLRIKKRESPVFGKARDHFERAWRHATPVPGCSFGTGLSNNEPDENTGEPPAREDG